MQNIKYILFILLLPLFSFSLYGQKKDTITVVKIDNSYLQDPLNFEFDLLLGRNSDDWQKFVNATFQFKFTDPAFKIEPGDLAISLVSTGLNIEGGSGSSGGKIPKTDYFIDTYIKDGRFCVTVLGPDSYGECITVPNATPIVIGRFHIRSLKGKILPREITWMKPSKFYQACAYKTDIDIKYRNIIWYVPDDNIEMDDDFGKTVKYEEDTSTEPIFVLKEFTSKYVGGKNVELDWITSSEAYCSGFILRRGIRPDLFVAVQDLEYNQIVATYKTGELYSKNLIGNGTTPTEHTYSFKYDTVQYRGGDYCYSLSYVDYDDKEHHLAYSCSPVPNAVIVYANPSENPFTTTTTIDYIVDDDVIMTVKVFDVTGQLIKTLTDGSGQKIENMIIRKGQHSTVFDASDLSAQGMYDVIFIAYPIDDPSVEISRAIVKTQLLR